mmetsp:Transcript_11656/g.46922  ORF Transcript_11656/g.46922 Transcript_11656/m.46922 type:complete len:225 (-) Transcript_11656:239-913(-)
MRARASPPRERYCNARRTCFASATSRCTSRSPGWRSRTATSTPLAPRTPTWRTTWRPASSDASWSALTSSVGQGTWRRRRTRTSERCRLRRAARAPGARRTACWRASTRRCFTRRAATSRALARCTSARLGCRGVVPTCWCGTGGSTLSGPSGAASRTSAPSSSVAATAIPRKTLLPSRRRAGFPNAIDVGSRPRWSSTRTWLAPARSSRTRRGRTSAGSRLAR